MAPAVLINDLILFRQRTGIGFYLAELLSRLESDGGSPGITRLSRTAWGKPLARLMRFYGGAAAGGGAGSPKRRLGAPLVGAARRFGYSGIDAYLSLVSPLSRWAVYHEPDAIPVLRGSRTVVTIHDLSVLRFPEWHPKHRVVTYERRLRASLGRIDHFIAVSSCTRDDIVSLLGVSSQKITVIPLAPRSVFRKVPAGRIRAKLGLPARYFLFVGTIEPRKNVLGLINAFRALPVRLRAECPLVLAGAWGWRSEPVRDLLERVKEARYTGYLSDEELVELTSGALALVYPSFYEGFGLPPLEAMKCGVPVITTHRGSLAETVGDAAIIVEPEDEAAIARAMRELAESPELASRFTEKGAAHTRSFRWEETARLTRNLYRALSGESRESASIP